jgi:uncharacterized protein DUF3761
MRIRVGVLAGAFFSLTLVAASSLAAQATAATVCKDGTTSATSGRGACSGHGGVDAKATDAAKKGAAKADKAASAAAKTTDKTAKSTEKTADKAAKSTEKTADKAAAKTASKTGAAAAKPTSKAEKTESKAAEKAAAPKTKTAATGADNNDPTNATAQCKDGTYSHAKNHQGACSNHGGVAKFLK